MGISTSTGTLVAGTSRTFNLAPASAITLTLPPNCRVTITESPATVAATSLGGNATRVHNPRLPGTFTYGPYPMGGSVLVENGSNSGSSVGWVRSDALIAESVDGTSSLVDGAGNSILNLDFPVASYGRITPAKKYATAAMTSGSAVLSVVGYAFTDADVGSTVGVLGAGVVSADYTVAANDGVLVGTVLSTADGVATLSVSATNTVSNAQCVFGVPIDTAIAAAVAACRAAYATTGISGQVVIPPGNYIAVASLPTGSGVGFRGAGRTNTRVFVVKVVADANDSTTASWIRKADGEGSALYDRINLNDFAVDGTYFAAVGTYGPDMKMISMSLTSNSTVQRLEITNNPSTALGFDESENCLIADNIILFPGRLARPNLTTGSSGGSGIGIATGSAAAATARGGRGLSMILRNNFIRGNWTVANGVNGTGRAGINIEASSATTAPTTYQNGILIEGNIIEGFFNGIVDSGGQGTVVRGNIVRKCTNGIKAGTNGVSTGGLPRDMQIIGNDVSDSITISTANAVGIVVTSTSAAVDTRGRVKVAHNKVRGSAGYGIQINGATSYPVENVDVFDNDVSESGLSGIRISGTTLKGLTVVQNRCISNGKLGTGGNTAPISVGASSVWTDGQLSGNTYLDYAGSPTQDASASISTSASLPGVFTDLQGTATLVGGTVTVTRQQITANSIVRITRRTTGGTLGHLSVALTAGTSFTINSSSGTDTSTVLWEIVQF